LCHICVFVGNMAGKSNYIITVSGLVQGVGFRPYVYRLAMEAGLDGWVLNTNEDVRIGLLADPGTVERFVERIRQQAPPASSIREISVEVVPREEYSGFRIIASEDLSAAVTQVSPDIAVCEECLHDMKQPSRRLDYPFLNCTNCGPRFTIIVDLPYDRARTTMQEFDMCPDCRREYGNIRDRRFHAQPTACARCGPEYSLVTGSAKISGIQKILNQTARLIDGGGILAVKGLGGFFLACDALNEAAVRRLRDSKHREGKPFAVMFRDLAEAGQYCEISDAEASLLTSWRRPIVVLREKHGLAPAVSNGFATIGAMLPYMPFHHLLFERLQCGVIVLTSGNLAEEPIIIDNGQAEDILAPVTDALLHYNRDIHNRADDTVAMVAGGEPRLLRRSRGYVPTPVLTTLSVEGIFAAGAELMNCFCLGKGNQAILSQHIGDLKNFETLAYYRETVERFRGLFRMEPVLAACDLHPDYLSTRYVREMGWPVVAVQHHHAHIASVMAEHGVDEPVIGVSFDGTGMGDDGHIWGSEFLVCDLAGYRRHSHLAYMPMPGGDMATKEPWRMAVSYLYPVYGRELLNLGLPFLGSLNLSRVEQVIQAIEKNIHCPLSSGAGRLFDAVAALLGLCPFSSFHAEAPMRLENAARPVTRGTYPYGGGIAISMAPAFQAMVEDILGGVGIGQIASRFHNTVAEIMINRVRQISRESGIRTVVLGGGTFQNRYLSSRVESDLRDDRFRVLVPAQVPTNDGGIALGQLVVAAKKREKGDY
jgi:hydrogenase maturation protein HypF